MRQIENGNVPLAPFDVRQETAINAYLLRHFYLSPATFLPQLPNPFSQANEQGVWHATCIMACRLFTTNLI